MGDYKKSGGFGAKKNGGFRDRNDRGGRPSFGSRPSYGGGKPFFGGRPSFNRGDRDDGPREMFQAVCNDCHKSCQVPFRPTGDKPVYCSDCFGAHRVGENRENRGQRENRGGQDRFPRRDSFSAPRREFTPSFSPKVSMGDKRIDELKRQLDVISIKVDTIFRIVSGKTLAVEPLSQKPKKAIDMKSVAESLKNMMMDAGNTEKKDGKKTEKKVVSKRMKKNAEEKVEKKTQKKPIKKKAVSKKK